ACLAGGVSASTRLNRAVGHAMLFDRAEGCRVWDLDGREYLDLCCSHGATLLGHGDARVRRAVEGVLARGAACSYENELHTELARLLCETIPCCERVRFTGSGTEATLHCIRLARAFTGRSKLLKFEGNFHGYHDQVMYAIGTPADQLGPESAPTRFPGSKGMAPGGAQQYLQVTPDVCTLGKAVGGGMPLSVFGGRRDIMERLMPQGDCQHSGTYNGHPTSVAAAIVALTAYRQAGFYEHIFT